MRLAALLFVMISFLLAGPVMASNLGVGGGALFPVSDFADFTDTSPYLGAHWEIQDVNALGQTAVMSALIYGGFGFLQADAELEGAPGADGDDGSYFDIGLGARAYSTASPLFVGIGAGYANIDLGGGAESANAFQAHIGLGFSIEFDAAKLDIEGRGNIALPDEGDSLQYFQLLAMVGLPF